MLHLTPSMSYYLYPYPADMRLGFHSLSELVRANMDECICSDKVFIFINRSCTGMKILHLEHGMLVIYQIILPKGHFRLPEINIETGILHTSWQNLMEMFQHVDKSRIIKRKKR